jgi:hypothetical protein
MEHVGRLEAARRRHGVDLITAALLPLQFQAELPVPAVFRNGDSTDIPAAISGETPLTSAGRFAEDSAPWKRGASDD